MKILYIHRAKNKNRHSFEELFRSINSVLSKEFTIINYYQNEEISTFANIKVIKKIDCDIIHLTGGLGYYTPFLPKRKTILTIHDTNHYEFDLKGLKKWLFGWLFFKMPSLFVAKLTTVSQHTKNNLIRFFNIDEQKIKVIPNCYPAEFKPVIKNDFSNPIKVLQIGTKPNKNIPRLIEAIHELDVELTIIGKLSTELKNILTKYKINFVNKVNLSREEMQKEYTNCDIVAFISLHEGFGLPIIESNAIGRTVITSNLSSMPEVAGNAAHLVNPHNIEAIKNGFIKLMNENEYRTQLIENGWKNAQLYTPEIIAEQYQLLYTEIITS